MDNFSDFDVFLLALGALGFGMWLLIKGGDVTVDAATAIAERFNIPNLLIGFTIVAFGTSLPELLVSVNANFKDSAGIALGNVIGSNIANILLVIGAAAVFYPVIVEKKEIQADTIMMLAASFLLTGLLATHYGVPSLLGLGMVIALIVGTIYQYLESKGEPHVEEKYDTHRPVWRSTGVLIFGLMSVAIGADVLVRGAIVAATYLHVPDALIGLTVIAIGTSLPELSTSIAAALKKQSGIVVGNVMGSNFFNVLLVIGASAALKPIPDSQITPQMASVDGWVMSIVALVFGLILVTRGKFGRMAGLVMLTAYAIYIGVISVVYGSV